MIRVIYVLKSESTPCLTNCTPKQGCFKSVLTRNAVLQAKCDTAYQHKSQEECVNAKNKNKIMKEKKQEEKQRCGKSLESWVSVTRFRKMGRIKFVEWTSREWTLHIFRPLFRPQLYEITFSRLGKGLSDSFAAVCCCYSGMLLAFLMLRFPKPRLIIRYHCRMPFFIFHKINTFILEKIESLQT